MEIEGLWFHFRAQGHENVTARHPTTIEITKEGFLTKRGDCIIGVSSEAGALDLPGWLKERIRAGWIVIVVLCASEICDSVVGVGDPGLELSGSTKIILRKSTYVEPSTVMLRANKAARDLRRDLVKALSEGSGLDVYMTAVPPPSYFKRLSVSSELLLTSRGSNAPMA